MHDPFTLNQRQFIPWAEYQQRERDIARETLIGQSNLSPEKIHSRIRELTGIEKRFGIVYLGERQWLESCVTEGEKHYSTWIRNRFQELFDGGLMRTTNETLGECWHGYTENLSPFWRPPELADAWIRINDIDLSLPGDESVPDDEALCEAFRILHNLAYYLHNVPHQDSRPVTLDRITVERETGYWFVDVISDYGSVWSVEFFGDEVRQGS